MGEQIFDFGYATDVTVSLNLIALSFIEEETKGDGVEEGIPAIFATGDSTSRSGSVTLDDNAGRLGSETSLGASAEVIGVAVFIGLVGDGDSGSIILPMFAVGRILIGGGAEVSSGTIGREDDAAISPSVGNVAVRIDSNCGSDVVEVAVGDGIGRDVAGVVGGADKIGAVLENFYLGAIGISQFIPGLTIIFRKF